MASSIKVTTFNGKGDVNAFLVKVDLYNKLKKFEGEDAAVSLASRLEEPAFNVYLRMSEADRKDIKKIQDELRKQYEVGNRNREEALHLLTAAQRKEDETAKDFAFRVTDLVKLAYPSFHIANRQIHEKDVFVRGQHPDMQMKLKTLENFDTLTIKQILDNTVRLEVAGVKSVTKKYRDDVNSVDDLTCDDVVPDNEGTLLKRLDGLEDAIAKLTAVTNTSDVSVVTSTPTKRRYEKGYVHKKPWEDRRPKVERKCWNCGDKTHLIRQCTNRYCQSCGQKGHDAWNKTCPKNS